MSITVENPKVTLVMPVFNGGRYFQIALESAFAQTYENLEIVVVNDGSTDGGETESIALRYGSRIRYIRQENKGVGGALNAGIRDMTGDFFAWLSYDSIHLPHKTASQIAFFRRLSKPEAILFSDYEMIDSDGKVISVKLPHREFVANPSLPLMNACIKACTLLIPTSIIKRFGEFDESLRYIQDYDLCNKILAKHAFFHQPAILAQTRFHPGQYSDHSAAAAEGDALWIRMLDSRTPIEQAQMFGSRQRYFTSLGRVLAKTPYQAAARYAGEQASASGSNLTFGARV
jgi:glycosyltransferase involved in cell wall biosynthesis